MYMQRVFFYPKPQNIDEVRTLLVERITPRQAQGVRVALAELVAGSNTPQFTVSTLYDNLAVFEVARQQYQSDPGSQSFMAKIGSLIREPAAFDLLEVLLPMPS